MHRDEFIPAEFSGEIERGLKRRKIEERQQELKQSERDQDGSEQSPIPAHAGRAKGQHGCADHERKKDPGRRS